jgi:methoxymalonate biosynthesis acyl carrier protein
MNADRAEIAQRISRYLNKRLGATVQAQEDIYERGLVTSMFAMELVVQLEQAFSIEILGPDLQLANFRSVDTMTDLVLKLRTV